MFWRFGGYANISTLDTILDKPDVTLEELLDESDLIQELKAQNAKLIEFLRDETVLERLLKYVVAPRGSRDEVEQETGSVEKRSGGLFSKTRHTGRSKSRSTDDSEQDKHEKQRLKYAFVACEILSSEVWSISESLLECQDHLRRFWDYMKSDAPLDPLQAGYFTKVNESLLEKKTEEMIAFIKTLDNVVPNMMMHVDCPMIMDLLLKLISLEKDRGGQGIVDWLQEQDLIPILLSYITADHSAATQTSAGDFLKAIITISANATGQDTSVIGPNELTRQLVSDACVENLNDQMLKGGSPLTVGVGIIIEVIRKNNSDYDSDAQIGPEPKTSDPIYLGSLLRIFAKHIPNFMELILSPQHSIMTEKGSKTIERQDLKVAWGDKIEPLGFDRFKTCELMAELLHCSNMGLLNERGSQEEVRRRDTERENLKAQGKLAASTFQEQPSTTDFGTSVDSSGFHNEDEYVSLSGSPNDPKGLAAQSAGDEDGFEKVAMSDLQDVSYKPEAPTNQDIPESELPQVHLKEVSSSSSGDMSDDESTSPAHGLTSQVEAMDIDKESKEDEKQTPNADTESVVTNEAPEKRLSLLSQQIQARKDAAETDAFGEAAEENGSQPCDTPAPLFSSNSFSNPFSKSEHESNLTSSDMGMIKGPRDDDEGAFQRSTLRTTDNEDDGTPVVGDLLKVMFVENKVVPIILDFFFRFPWNNFLHNVVYDVVQQVFNGAMDRGYNRNLAIDLFETGRITERIIEGQQRSAALEKQKNMRLGYMGHLTLIAEEVVKFTERQPADSLDQSVVDKVTHPDWIHYVEHILADTREKDNAILGGVRPDAVGGPRQAVLNAVNAAQSGFGNNNSAAVTDAGLSDNPRTPGLDSMDLANAGRTEYGSDALVSGFGNSSDEEEEDLEEAESTDAKHTSADQQSANDEDQPSMVSNVELSNIVLNQPPIPRARERFEAVMAQRQTLDNSTTTANNPFANSSHEELIYLDPGLPSSASATLAPMMNPFGIFKSLGIGSSTTSSHDNKTAAGPHIDVTARSSSSSRGFEYADGNDDEPGVSLKEYAEGDVVDKHDNDNNNNNDDDDPASGGLKRQSTREALERRPLDSDEDNDDDDDDDDVQDYDSAGFSSEEDEAAAEIMEHVRPDLATRRQHSGEGASSTASKASLFSVDTPSASEAATLRLGQVREQERVQNQWGIPTSASRSPEEQRMDAAQGRYDDENDDGDDEDDDDDDDDGVIEMGTKYMRRGSRSSNGSANSA